MDNDKIINRLNKFLKNHTFTIEIMNEPEFLVDFKFEISGEKQLISVGEWTDYYTYTIYVVGTKNEILNRVFSGLFSEDKEITLSNNRIPIISYMTRKTDDALQNLFDYYGFNKRVIATKLVSDLNNELI